MSDDQQPRTTSGVDRSRLAVFRRHEAHALDTTGMMIYQRTGEHADYSKRVIEAGILDGTVVEQLFRHDGTDGFSLARAQFKPNFHLARHSHDCDCLYYVLGGSLQMGSVTLGPGDGFFVPKDRPYGYVAGPEGAEVLEFRHATDFSFVMRESAAGLERIIESVIANHTVWVEDVNHPARPA